MADRELRFEAVEQCADGALGAAAFRFAGSSSRGWQVDREGVPVLSLGPGYELLRSTACGVCATDLARPALPFPLPQVTGHEVLACDDADRRRVVEINASHRARGVAHDCAFCRADLERHCPERLVLGIHDLPGGFGPWLLAPCKAALPVPDRLPDATAVLAEPFAAALHAVRRLALDPGDRVAVLGPRRLGMLVIAALASERRRSGRRYRILALARRPGLLEHARTLGADEVQAVDGDGAHLEDGLAEVVIDTTGTPEGFALALRLARREVHLKSTHGRPAAGLRHATELVVDEIGIAPLASIDRAQHLAWLLPGDPPPTLAAEHLHRGLHAAAVAEALAATGGLGRADVAAVADLAGIDAVLRPDPQSEVSLVRPGGLIALAAGDPQRDSEEDAPLLEAVRRRGLRLSSSRCGDLRAALEVLAGDTALHGLGDALVTHRFPAERLAEAFAAARSPDCLKACVEHPRV